MNLQQSPAFWIGYIEEADRQIEFLSKMKSKPMRKKLAEVKRLKADAMAQLRRLSGC